MARFVIRDSKENLVGYISKESDDYEPYISPEERAEREEAEKRREEIIAKQKPARILVKTLLWFTLLIGLSLGGGKAHEKLGFALIGVAWVGYLLYGNVLFRIR